MKKKKKASKKGKDKEEVCEVFEIEKDGKETIKKVCGEVEKKEGSEKDMENHNIILRNLLIGFGCFVLIIFLGLYIVNSARYFDYNGVKGEVVKEGGLVFYKVAFPVNVNGTLMPYYIYIRNNPEELAEEIPFRGGFSFGEKFDDNLFRMVLNFTDKFECEEESKKGDEDIAVANLLNLKVLGLKIMKDESADCDPNGRYMFVNIKEGNVSEIRDVGPACYEISVNNCEILKVTERLMIEAFEKYYRMHDIEWEF